MRFTALYLVAASAAGVLSAPNAMLNEGPSAPLEARYNCQATCFVPLDTSQKTSIICIDSGKTVGTCSYECPCKMKDNGGNNARTPICQCK